MATVREYFDVTAKALNANREWELSDDNGVSRISIYGKLSHSIEENSKYWSFYFPAKADISCIDFILSQPNVAEGVIEYGELEQEIGFVHTPERQKLSAFFFTNRVYIYIDKALSNFEIQAIHKLGDNYGFNIKIRDINYVKKCAELEKPLAFISHDFNDKDDLVRELAIELNKKLCPVWYDEFSLKIGDSLRESIEKGLKESKKCILVLSPSFISNSGWTKKEFNSIIMREIFDKNNVILPIWHNVSAEDVYNYSPDLLDRFGLQSSLGPAELAEKIVEKIRA
ncbi:MULTISPECIES: toll/interleukin-1 receptor domain-containing protein [unclassified Salinivibrio]|uniref:toll/interleukin-1 receptor domain-containing protein n=1 Tax=unclassified Salinivibrio TaxID=2636825 RepID=UPI00128C04A0|nr:MULTISPECIES: toll/interleukin-1 receptor domain-containing protein [unclassified Salinivibrio]MPS31452.1 toll/interleukin-1 receptor domain-containing protein [Salinivibrio sp. VYel7]MPX92848.1 toll/interleukin-1 receptor domain-containing protein [Salinivibrio sp. VYel9]MPX95468.1 toll/interleukin-1 receptor domain-containing protein [Salinivibrio sp. VYel6]MPX99066.1 toll/interleukin-1 receptor domain-containing protein [Salinivibrio sp. VYel4]MPY02227.1 toll/interleukin-1 receptor domai